MSYDEYVAHFSLWCLVKSPLLIGCDVTNITKETLGILTNAEVIALNQDALGVQGHKVWNNSMGHEVWAGPLANGDVAVVLLNRAESTANITAQWSDIGVKAGMNATVRDLWLKQGLGTYTDSITLSVVTHGSRTLRIASSSSSVAAVEEGNREEDGIVDTVPILKRQKARRQLTSAMDDQW